MFSIANQDWQMRFHSINTMMQYLVPFSGIWVIYIRCFLLDIYSIKCLFCFSLFLPVSLSLFQEGSFTLPPQVTSLARCMTFPGQQALSRNASALNNQSTGLVVRHSSIHSFRHRHLHIKAKIKCLFTPRLFITTLFLTSASDPEFVSSAFIQEDEKNNPTGEDDKIYFFFTEVAKEYDLYTKVKVPRVARVCKVGTRAGLFSCLVSLAFYFFNFVFNGLAWLMSQRDVVQ